MNKTLIFLIISISVLVLSAVVICVAPIINNIEVEITTSAGSKTWAPSDWRNINCDILADQEKKEGVLLDEMQKYKKYKNLCYRQKATHALEHSAFIIDSILAFICADLTLLHYLNISKNFEKKTGLFGIISGIIGFIITLVYLCYSGYIFNNDVAFGILDPSNTALFFTPTNFKKLYPNGALYKWEGSYTQGEYITVNNNNKEENAEFLLYKELGEKQYNYNSEYYETYKKNIPTSSTNPNQCNIDETFNGPLSPNAFSLGTGYCDYLYYKPSNSVENKYIYDRWLTTLIIAGIIVVCNLLLTIFGFLLFKNTEETAPSSGQTPEK